MQETQQKANMHTKTALVTDYESNPHVVKELSPCTKQIMLGIGWQFLFSEDIQHNGMRMSMVRSFRWTDCDEIRLVMISKLAGLFVINFFVLLII
jgi:hypothetical protein